MGSADLRVRAATSDDIAMLSTFVIDEAREAEGRTLDREAATKAVTAAIHDPLLARYWLAIDDHRPVGAVAVTREWSDWNAASYWYIQFVFVVPELRGRGVLGLLVEHVVAAAREAGAPELRLYVHPDNARAVRAYERLGFAALPYLMMAMPLVRSETTGAELDDDALWAAFHDRSLTHARWTHTAHLRVAWMHLARYGIDEAHLRMRIGIVRLNTAHGVPESPQRGYHETLTRVWLALVGDARRREPCADSATFVAQHGLARSSASLRDAARPGEAGALHRDAPLRHYSRERLFSLEARAMFVAPDLAPLPA
jgi:ribosomal protein S18 acetylase RimI-like enzyme